MPKYTVAYQTARKQRAARGTGKYPCPKCPVKIGRQMDLKRHMKKHEKKELPYKCAHCPRAFLEKSNLKIHEQLEHLGLTVALPMLPFAMDMFATESVVRQRSFATPWQPARQAILKTAQSLTPITTPRPTQAIMQPQPRYAKQYIQDYSSPVDNSAWATHDTRVDHQHGEHYLDQACYQTHSPSESSSFSGSPGSSSTPLLPADSFYSASALPAAAPIPDNTGRTFDYFNFQAAEALHPHMLMGGNVYDGSVGNVQGDSTGMFYSSNQNQGYYYA